MPRLCAKAGGACSAGLLFEWDASTLEELRRLRCEDDCGPVLSKTACGDLVIASGQDDDDECLRVWNTATGASDHVLRGHTAAVWCVALSGQHLVSGSGDKTVKVWSMEGTGSWPCLVTIAVHTHGVWAVVVWEGRVISGSEDKTIVVSDIVTRQHEVTLDAHTRAYALAVSGRTLVSTGWDCTIGVWALGTWSHLRWIRVIEHVPDARLCLCLAVSGSMLLCGGQRKGPGDRSGFVVVLDSDTLSYQHTLRFDRSVSRLLSVRGEVWGRLDFNVVVWGKAEREEGLGMSEAGMA